MNDHKPQNLESWVKAHSNEKPSNELTLQLLEILAKEHPAGFQEKIPEQDKNFMFQLLKPCQKDLGIDLGYATSLRTPSVGTVRISPITQEQIEQFKRSSSPSNRF